jgi:putative methanogen marker protein 4
MHDSHIHLLTNSSIIKDFNPNLNDLAVKSSFSVIDCINLEKEVFEFLNNGTFNAIVRGSFSSTKFLKNLKLFFNLKEVNRLALLETNKGFQFFFGPVGIDECNNLTNKLTFLELALQEMEHLNINPKISILSGGRNGDSGRNEIVDKTLAESHKLVKIIKEKYPELDISHDEILIEKAISKKSNLILAPDGISGNLIYRTLVHLGGGKAYGAIYMGLKKSIIDTSRVAELSEIEGALILALALSE